MASSNSWPARDMKRVSDDKRGTPARRCAGVFLCFEIYRYYGIINLCISHKQPKKAGESRVMLCFASQTITLDLSPIIDALTKKAVKEMEARVNKRIAEILGEMDDMEYMPSDYAWALLRVYQDLEEAQHRIKKVWKVLNKRNGEILRRLRQQRDQYSKRGNASSVTDKALLTMPTPPTVMDAEGILWRGGVLSAAG